MKMVEKATVFERFNHWALALSFFVLTLTGLGFLFAKLAWLNSLFGGKAMSATIHEWAGVVFMVSLLFSIGSYLSESLSFAPEDREWIRLRGGYLSKDKVPPQGKLNAGQKLFYITVLLIGALISVSGLIMWLAADSRQWMTIGHLLHNLAFVVLVATIPAHIYLATAANPGTFRIMTRGTVPIEWARKRHARWIKELNL